MKNCFEVFSHFLAFCTEMYTQFHVSIQCSRSNNAKEYFSKQFKSFMLQNSFLHQNFYVDTPSHNGIAKRKK